MSDAKSPEPSIEEILASIRKIISDDEPEPDAEVSQEEQHAPDDEILELTDIVFDAPPPPPADEDHYQEEPRFDPPAPAPRPAAVPVTDIDDIASEETVAAASGAFAKLSHPMPAHAEAPAQSSGGKSVEDIVRELLRPILRQWIDQNLAAIVERSVERELRKISRKAEDS